MRFAIANYVAGGAGPDFVATDDAERAEAGVGFVGQNAGGGQFAAQPRRRMLHVVRHVGKAVVQALAVSCAWPVDFRGRVAGLVQAVVECRHANQVGLVSLRVERHRRSGSRANQYAIKQHAVFLRPYAGHQRSVVGPGDGRVGNVHSFRRGAGGRQSPNCGQRQLGIVQQICRKAVDADHDDMPIGRRRMRGGRRQHGQQDSTANKQATTHRGGLFRQTIAGETLPARRDLPS